MIIFVIKYKLSAGHICFLQSILSVIDIFMNNYNISAIFYDKCVYFHMHVVILIIYFLFQVSKSVDVLHKIAKICKQWTDFHRFPACSDKSKCLCFLRSSWNPLFWKSSGNWVPWFSKLNIRKCRETLYIFRLNELEINIHSLKCERQSFAFAWKIAINLN